MHKQRGIYAAAVTPRRLGTQDINLGATWDLLDFLAGHGVDGVVLLGATGEFVHFSVAERMRLMGLAAKRSRVPVIINVSYSTLDGAVELAQGAGAAGLSGLLLMPPYFYHYGQADVEAFYFRFAQEADVPLPTLLYNLPAFTNEIGAETAATLLKAGLFAGIKDSSGNWDRFLQLKELAVERPFTIMMGSDLLFSRAIAEGADGAISGVACAVPELLVSLNRALRNGSGAAAALLDERLAEFISWLQRFPVPVALREAVMLRGIKTGPHAIQLSSEQTTALGEFRDWFLPWLGQVQKECTLA